MGEASSAAPPRTQFVPPPPLQYPDSDEEKIYPHNGYTCSICGAYRTHFSDECPAGRCGWCKGWGHNSLYCTKEADEPPDEYVCKICDAVGQHLIHDCPKSTCQKCRCKGHLATVCPSAVRGRNVPADYMCGICDAVGDHYRYQCPEAVCGYCGARGHIASSCDRDISRCICKRQLQHGECRQRGAVGQRGTCRFAHLSSRLLVKVCALVRQARCQFPDEWSQVAHAIGGEDHHGAMLAFDVVYRSLPHCAPFAEKTALLDRVRMAPDGREMILALVAIQEEFANAGGSATLSQEEIADMGGSATRSAVAPRAPAARPSSVTASSSQLPPGLLGVERMAPVALECPLCFEPCTFKSALSSSETAYPSP